MHPLYLNSVPTGDQRAIVFPNTVELVTAEDAGEEGRVSIFSASEPLIPLGRCTRRARVPPALDSIVLTHPVFRPPGSAPETLTSRQQNSR